MLTDICTRYRVTLYRNSWLLKCRYTRSGLCKMAPRHILQWSVQFPAQHFRCTCQLTPLSWSSQLRSFWPPLSPDLNPCDFFCGVSWRRRRPNKIHRLLYNWPISRVLVKYSEVSTIRAPPCTRHCVPRSQQLRWLVLNYLITLRQIDHYYHVNVIVK
jgi:hypothetical protein